MKQSDDRDAIVILDDAIAMMAKGVAKYEKSGKDGDALFWDVIKTNFEIARDKLKKST